MADSGIKKFTIDSIELVGESKYTANINFSSIDQFNRYIAIALEDSSFAVVNAIVIFNLSNKSQFQALCTFDKKEISTLSDWSLSELSPNTALVLDGNEHYCISLDDVDWSSHDKNPSVIEMLDKEMQKLQKFLERLNQCGAAGEQDARATVDAYQILASIKGRLTK